MIISIYYPFFDSIFGSFNKLLILFYFINFFFVIHFFGSQWNNRISGSLKKRKEKKSYDVNLLSFYYKLMYFLIIIYIYNIFNWKLN